MKKITVILVTLILLSVLMAGCTEAQIIGNAASQAAGSISDVMAQQCKQACDNHNKMLPPGCSCPKPTSQPSANITPTQSGI